MKKKWLLFPALLLAIAGLVMIGCKNSTTLGTGGEGGEGGEGGGVGEGFFELDLIHVPSGDGAGYWWKSNGCDDATTTLSIATLKSAKYLIMEVISKASENGFGGIQLAVQSDGDSWDWNETTICADWNKPEASSGHWDITYASEEAFYLVVDTSKLEGWSSLVSSATKGKIKINTWPSQLKALPAVNGYLANSTVTLTKPATGFAIAKDGVTFGWAQKDAPTGLFTE